MDFGIRFEIIEASAAWIVTQRTIWLAHDIRTAEPRESGLNVGKFQGEEDACAGDASKQD
jgi:hypothetical protein